MDGCESSKDKPELKPKQVKKCAVLDKKMAKCGYDCGEKEPMTPEEVLKTCSHRNVQFSGTDLFYMYYIHIEDCIRDCLKSESCQAISYSTSEKKCYFKSMEGGSTGPIMKAGWISANMDCDRSDVELTCQRIGFNYAGGDLISYSYAVESKSMEHCTLFCRDTEACRAIVYRESDGHCWLKEKRGGSSGPSASAGHRSMNMECDKEPIKNLDCMREGINFYSAALSSLAVADAEECAQHCKETEACKSITFTDSNHQCYLKSRYGGYYPQVAAGHRSMNMECDNSEVKNLGCLRKGFNFIGADIGNLVVEDVEECVKRCRDTEDCKAITFRVSDNRCYLKSKAGGETGPQATAGHNSMNLECDNGPVKNMDCLRDEIDFPGADLQNFVVEEKEDCVRHCRDTERCKALVFTESDDQIRCYLKYRRGGSTVPVEKAGYKSMNMECDNSKVSNLDCIRKGIAFNGADIGNTVVADVKACVKVCRDTEGCQSFSFRLSDKQCYAKDRRGGSSGPSLDRGYNSMNMVCDNSSVADTMKCLRKGLDFPGSEMKNIIVADEEECVQHCKDTENCQAVTFKESTHRCYLKSKRGGSSGPTVSPGYNSLNMECDNSKPAQLQCATMDEKFPGHDIRHIAEANFEDCLRRCRDTEGCEAVSFRETDNVCELKSTTFEWWRIKSHYISVNMNC